MNFLSIRPRFHSSLTSPSACTRLLAPHASSRSPPPPPPPQAASGRRKAPRSAPRDPRVGSPRLWAKTPVLLLRSRHSPTQTQGARASFPREGSKGRGPRRQRRRAEAGQDTRGLRGEPQLPRGFSGWRSVPRAPARPCVGHPRARARCLPGPRRRPGAHGRPAGAPGGPRRWPGVCGWRGGGAGEGEMNLFGWSRVRVSRFPYPGIAGGAAIGSQDHVGP